MTILEIIDKKRLKKELNKDELDFAIKGYLDGSVKDYQMSSLLMAIVLNGMSEKEIVDLTDIMLHSGDIIDLSKIEGIIVDKHSTGGVGDKVTLVLGPLLASLGIKIAKMSGRGLGHTGGTIDKLESIEGFKVALEEAELLATVLLDELTEASSFWTSEISVEVPLAPAVLTVWDDASLPPLAPAQPVNSNAIVSK